MEIKGRIAIVTGAASGIGKAVAQKLMAEGAEVVLVDRSWVEDPLWTGGHTVFAGDVTSSSFRREVFQEIQHIWPGERATILVPAAGITRDAFCFTISPRHRMKVYPEKDARELMNVNLIAPALWASEMMARVHFGRIKAFKDIPADAAIVYIGSISAEGNPGQWAYAASKAGLVGVAKTQALEWKRYGARVSVVHPGFTGRIESRMVSQIKPEVLEKVVKKTASQRVWGVEEVADVIVQEITDGEYMYIPPHLPSNFHEVWLDKFDRSEQPKAA